VRSRPLASSRRGPLSLARIVALTGTLVLHILALAHLWLNARVVPQPRLRSAIAVQLYEPEQRPAPAPAEPVPQLDTAAIVAPSPRPARAVPAAPVAAAAQPDAAELEFVPLPPQLSIEQQRAGIAAEIARENAPERRAFRGRSIDAMLPDGDKGMLPGFRPRTVDDQTRMMRKIGQMLSMGIPTAAVDPDAPLDLLTEGWEARHHDSDLAACELQYEELDPDMRRKMCGAVGPGL
jgi:hypothetical protein